MQIIPQSTSVDNLFHEFAAHLHRGGAWSYFWAKLPSGRKWSHWYPAGRRPIVPAAWAGADIYFTVHPARPSARRSVNHRAKVIDVAAVNCLYAEYDDKDFTGRHEGALARLLQVDPAPSAIVDSGGGFHAYWLLSEPLAVTPDTSPALEASQKAWVHYAGGDLTVHDLARVLRVPGSLNFKYSPPRPVSFVHLNMATVYRLAELLEVTPPPLWEKVETPSSRLPSRGTISPPQGDGAIDALRRRKMERAGQLAKFEALWAGQWQDWCPSASEGDFHLCRLIAFWWGRDPALVERLWRDSGAWRPDRNTDAYVNRTIAEAIRRTHQSWTPQRALDRAAVEAAAAAVGGNGQ